MKFLQRLNQIFIRPERSVNILSNIRSEGSISLSITGAGANSVEVIDGRVLIDGKEVADADQRKIVINVSPLVKIGSISCDTTLNFVGSIHAETITAKGNINGDDIAGNVSAGNNVNCDDIHGNVTANGNVNAGDIVGGDVRAGGNINAKRHK